MSEENESPGIGHNVGGVAGDRLRAFVERIERIEEEQAALAEDKKEIYAELKGVGFDAKTVKNGKSSLSYSTCTGLL